MEQGTFISKPEHALQNNAAEQPSPLHEAGWGRLSQSDMLNPAPPQARSDTPTVGNYIESLAKNVSLFIPGEYGLALSAATYSLSEIKSGDNATQTAEDMVLGGLKGIANKLVFNKLGALALNPAFTGVGLGFSSRFLDAGLSRTNYFDKNGQFDVAQGLNRIGDSAFNGKALLTDALIFSAGGVAAKQMGLALAKSSPLVRSIFTGSTFGLSSGAAGEILRQKDAGENFDASKVAEQALLNGVLTGVAAVPGGYMSRRINSGAQGSPPEREGSMPAKPGTADKSALDISIQNDSVAREVEGALKAENALDSKTTAQPAGDSHNLSLPALEKTLSDGPGSHFSISEPREELVEFQKFIGKPGEAIPASFGKFQAEMLRDEPRASVVYDINGFDTKVIVPKEYDAQLKTDPLTARTSLAPGDLPQLLSELPDPALIKEIRLLDESSPEDHWHNEHTGISSGANATPDGVVSFYTTMKGEEGRLQLKHEWSHVRYDNMDQAERAKVDAAGSVEKDGLHLRTQSTTAASENFAVTIGEGILHGDAQTFKLVVEQAPVRSLVAADVLEQSLANAGENSAYRDVWQNRIDYIRNQATEPARLKLVDIASNSADPKQVAGAARLLALYGKAEDFAAINRPLNIQLPDEPSVTDAVLKNITAAPQIDTLNLAGARGLSGETFSGLTKSGLTNLSIQNAFLGDSAAEPISRINTLTRLNASGVNFTDDSVPAIGRLQSLTDLFLARTHISSFGRQRLQELLPNTNIRFK